MKYIQFLFASVAFAQTLTLPPPLTAVTGATVTIPIGYVAPTVPNAVAFQFSIQITPVLATSATAVLATGAGTDPNLPNKAIDCIPGTPLSCLLAGFDGAMPPGVISVGATATKMDATPLGSGTLASVSFTAPGAGNYSIAILNVAAVDATGTFLSVAIPAPTTLAVTAAGPPPPNKFDVSGPAGVPDGVVDRFDVQAAIGGVMNAANCTPILDFNGDGRCDLPDVQLVINAAMAAGK